VSSTILTLLVIPVLYAMWRWREVKRLRRGEIKNGDGKGQIDESVFQPKEETHAEQGYDN